MRATTLRWSATGFVMTLFLTTSAAAQQPAADPPGEIDALAAKIEELDQQLRVLQRKLEIEREQAAEKVKVTPTVTAGRDGYALKSADGDFQVKFRGYIQADGRFVGDNDTTSGPTTFVLRRVRPVLEATAFKIFDFKLMPDFGGGQAVLYDAYADARFAPWLKLRVGKYKPQFGLERLQSATELTFIERGEPTNIAPNRDLGASLYGDLAGERLSYAIGVFNGVVDGGNADLDDKSGKDVLARIFALPFKNAESDAFKGLGAGFAVTSGSQHGTLTAPDLPTYKTAAQQTHFRYRADGTVEGTTVADGAHWRVGPQGYYYAGSVGFLSEYYGHRPKSLEPSNAVRPDRALTFDKVTSVHYSGTRHEEDQPPHLLVQTDVCYSRCGEEFGHPCQRFCPAHVYEMVEEGGRKRLQINAANCVHCKTCDIMDPYQVITWVPPEGGGGPQYDGL